MTEHPVIFVDLIEEKPLGREEWLNELGDSADPSSADEAYEAYVERFQPFRWHSTSEGNHEILGTGERYFNEADAEHNIRLQFAGDSIVFLRRAEHGNEMLRDAYPNDLGEILLLGPDCQAAPDGSVIAWKGVLYIPKPADPEPEAVQ